MKLLPFNQLYLNYQVSQLVIKKQIRRGFVGKHINNKVTARKEMEEYLFLP